MRISSVRSIESILDRSYKHQSAFYESFRRVGSKITGYVLEKLGSGGFEKRAALFPNIRSPRVVLDLLSTLDVDSEDRYFLEGFPAFKRGKPAKGIQGNLLSPIGLQKCQFCPWINAWVQFLIYLPKFPELISYAPKSLEMFREFFDQYLLDQRNGVRVSKADNLSLSECLSGLGLNLKLDISEISRWFFQKVFPPLSFFGIATSFCDSIVFQPEWFLFLDSDDSEAKIKAIVEKRPSEILVGMNPSSSSSVFLKKKQFSEMNGMFFYDLDAFIECRPDVHGAIYVAYVRIGNVWYQCDDEKVRIISCGTLNVPLSRGVLFHYKKKEWAIAGMRSPI